MIFYQDPSVQILQGDVLEQLQTLPDGNVQTVVTSPPYWGLRDYGIDGQMGLEKTPEGYIDKMVRVFREVRRVLKDDGTVWLNLGDSYAGYHGNKNSEIPTSSVNGWTNGTNENKRGSALVSLKPKDLIGIPWRVAFALQADGWYLRQDIIWHKPNPMPESVTDRCTKAHEYIFLLSKSGRYYYDADAIQESLTRPEEAMRKTPARFGGANKWEEAQKQSRLHSGNEYLGTPNGKRNKRTVWAVATQPYRGAHFATFPPKLIEPCILAGSRPGDVVLDPFSGSGTTCAVAKGFGRKAIGVELNPEYCALSIKRLSQVSEALAL